MSPPKTGRPRQERHDQPETREPGTADRRTVRRRTQGRTRRESAGTGTSPELAEALDADLEYLSQQDAYGNDLAMEQMEAEAAEIRQYGVDFDGTYLRHRGPHSGVPINGGFVRLWGRHTPETPSTPAATEPAPLTPAAEPKPARTQASPSQRPAAPKRKRQGFLKQMVTRELRSTINRAFRGLFR